MKKKVYLFGECYFQDIDLILNKLDINEEFQFSNLSIDSGSIYAFEKALKSRKFFEQGIFVVGGSVQDQWNWNKGETLKQVLKWFETSLYNSVLVWALTGQRDRAEDKLHNFYNQEKLKATNGKNVLSFDMQFEADKSKDGFHVSAEEKHNMSLKLIDFLKKINFHVEEVEINCLVNKIPIKACKKAFIFHGHNNALFKIINEDNVIKKYAYYLHGDNNTKGYIRHLDRLIITEISNPKPGFVGFSQEIYVQKVLFEF